MMDKYNKIKKLLYKIIRMRHILLHLVGYSVNWNDREEHIQSQLGALPVIINRKNLSRNNPINKVLRTRLAAAIN